MGRVFQYSVLLVLGLAAAMVFDLSAIRQWMILATLVGLAYIMMEVGLEFHLDKRRLKTYGKDYLIAFAAALLPWVFCALYFVFVVGVDVKSAFVVGRFAAPTSAGILMTMLAAAGLGTTWLFRKARILAIFEELDTVLFMVPLQIALAGIHWQLIVAILVLVALLAIAYRFLHELRLPSSSPWLFCYSLILVFVFTSVRWLSLIHIEVLMPAFVFGAILHNPRKGKHEHEYIEPHTGWMRVMDRIIKSSFVLLIGASLPRLQVGVDGYWMAAVHIVSIVVLMNLGKMFPFFCYKQVATWRERLALCIAMFPRAEVGVGVLIVSVGYGIQTGAIGLAAMALGLNLVLTGLYIWISTKLTRQRTYGSSKGK